MSIYLDHSATTPILDPVKEIIMEALESNYGNPSSLHRLGLNAEKSIKKARKIIGETLGVNDRQVVFTSGGTEANNLAILGSVRKERGRLITTSFEHPSVLNVFEQLEKEGYEVVYLEVNDRGHINLDSLKASLTTDTQLVSIMYINNEIGSIQDIPRIGSIINDFNQTNKLRIKFHVDAIQAYGKIPIDLNELKIDLLSVSAHKINGLKGCGALIFRQGIDIKPRMFGGGQEKEIRPGTENTIGIMAFGKAAELAIEHMKEHMDYVSDLKNRMLEFLLPVEGISVNGAGPQSPYILSLSFEGVKGEVLLHSLETSQIFVSTGSACNSKKQSFSHVLKAIKLQDSRIEGTLRISFSAQNSISDIEIAAQQMIKDYKMIKKMTKRR